MMPFEEFMRERYRDLCEKNIGYEKAREEGWAVEFIEREINNLTNLELIAYMDEYLSEFAKQFKVKKEGKS